MRSALRERPKSRPSWLRFRPVIALLQTETPTASETIASLFPLILIGGVFLFIMLRQRGRQRARQDMLNALEVGARVRSIGGIIGTISEIDDQEVVLDSDGTRLRIMRRAIQEPITVPESE